MQGLIGMIPLANAWHAEVANGLKNCPSYIKSKFNDAYSYTRRKKFSPLLFKRFWTHPKMPIEPLHITELSTKMG